MGVVGVLWVLYGYSEAFGQDKGGVVGDVTADLPPLRARADRWLSGLVGRGILRCV